MVYVSQKKLICTNLQNYFSYGEKYINVLFVKQLTYILKSALLFIGLCKHFLGVMDSEPQFDISVVDESKERIAAVRSTKGK